MERTIVIIMVISGLKPVLRLKYFLKNVPLTQIKFLFFPDPSPEKQVTKEKKEEPSSFFQRQRVDVLLGELAKKFPPKYPGAQGQVAVKQGEAKHTCASSMNWCTVQWSPSNNATLFAKKLWPH